MLNLRIKTSLITPTWLFVSVIFFFNALPSTIILITDYSPRKYLHHIDNFNDASLDYLISLFGFIIFFCYFRFLVFFQAGAKPSVNKEIATDHLITTYRRFSGFAISGLIFCICFVALYSFNGGFSKLVLLGSHMDSRDFRFLNFNEVSRVFTAGLQISRRFILPFLIVFYYLAFRCQVKHTGFLLLCTILIQLFASALTFARAPFLTLVAAIFIIRLFSSVSKFRLISEIALLIFSVVMVSGTITFIQYNITTFSLFDVWETGLDFSVNRAWFVPNVVPINLVFAEPSLMDNKLYLEYSRLSGLWGAQVVGTLEENSIYVAPVGYIGDVWRNFGLGGVLMFGAFCGYLFVHLDQCLRRLGYFTAYIYSFLILALIFYWVMGVVFSQGALFALLLVLVFPVIARKIE